MTRVIVSPSLSYITVSMDCINGTSTQYKNNRIHNFPDYEEIENSSILNISSSSSSETLTRTSDLQEMRHLIYDIEQRSVTLQL